ncbi:hypothetical protein FA15DRAFT_701090 [Coprinopsis marcescibilis]|uniref:Uncharacterized protein n=1 Tax=Coprinopsis marcescibilis TaxID=230819 RepID=A0A5C3L7A3_COPMA|nr:hypothetical protein FA15DRAFT_701090 [Coprinopsis marcescibilis]
MSSTSKPRLRSVADFVPTTNDTTIAVFADRDDWDLVPLDRSYQPVGENPDRYPGSKERLVFAVACLANFSVNNAMLDVVDIGISAVIVLVDERFDLRIRERPFYVKLVHWLLCTVAIKFIIVKIRVREWPESTRGAFNRTFGNLIRDGADYMDVDELLPRAIINYALNNDHFAEIKLEETIGGKPVVQTKARKIYKKNLDILAPAPLASWQ